MISGKNGKEAYETGDLDRGLFPVGVGCSLIHDVKSVGEVMEELMAETVETVRRLKDLTY